MIIGTPVFGPPGWPRGKAVVFLGSDTSLTDSPHLQLVAADFNTHIARSVSGVGDINGDGYLDIYVSVSGYGFPYLTKNILYINNGDLTFTDKTRQYGLDDENINNQAVFFDMTIFILMMVKNL